MKVIMIIVGVLIIFAACISFIHLWSTEYGAGLFGAFIGCLGGGLLGWILIKNGTKSTKNEQ